MDILRAHKDNRRLFAVVKRSKSLFSERNDFFLSRHGILTTLTVIAISVFIFGFIVFYDRDTFAFDKHVRMLQMASDFGEQNENIVDASVIPQVKPETLKEKTPRHVSNTIIPHQKPRSVFLDDNTSVTLNDEEKTNFLRMIRAAKNKRWSDTDVFLRKFSGQNHEFAKTVRDWMIFSNINHDKGNFEDVVAFIRAHPEWPNQRAMRIKAENVLNEKVPDARIIEWFSENPPITPNGTELFMSAMIRHGNIDQARQFYKEWWPTATLTPDQQAKFLNRYRSWVDESNNLLRIRHLIATQQYTNVRNLARTLGNDYKYMVEAKIRLSANKSGVDYLIGKIPSHLKTDPGLLYERLRWRRKRNLDAGAIDILLNPPPVDTIPNLKDWWAERHIIIRRLIEKKEYEKAYYIASKHMQTSGFALAQAEWICGWLALRFVNKPWEAFEHFERLYNNVETPISRSRGAYWAGRASDKLGHPDIAAEWYREAAVHAGTFYGQMALAALKSMPKDVLKAQKVVFQNGELKPTEDVTFSLNVDAPPLNFEEQRRFLQKDMTVAAIMFAKGFMRSEASDFLQGLADYAKTPADYRMIAELSTQINQPHDAILIAKKASYKGVILKDQAYPTVIRYLDDIDDVEWALIHGIIRQESAYDIEAQSSAGARGLMQLMPATAKYISRKKGMSYQQSWLTSRPEYNVRLGSHYINYLLDKYDGSYILALAAYNGGPGRVAQWMKTFGDPRDKEIGWIDWVELIPVYETRNYVQRVLESVHVYRLTLKGVGPDVSQEIHVANAK